jgi:hypothetical protein
MKRIIFLLALFMGVFGCLCPDDVTFWTLDDFDISLANLELETIESDTITGDSLFLFMNVDATIGASFSFGLSNTLLALDCYAVPRLRDGITKVDVFSNNDYNDIPAGESLGSIIHVFSDRSLDDIIRFSDDLVDEDLWDFLFIERPAFGSSHQFTIRLDFDSGRVLERQSRSIIWN